MAKIVKIDLENLRFYSYHGFYAEEQVLGNEYFVSLRTRYESRRETDYELQHTVNYERLYEFASTSMREPRKLLETVAEEILQKIKIAFPELYHVEVSIRKNNPPFGGDMAQAVVSLVWDDEAGRNSHAK
jgi:dihydroneopterin aldolase